MEAATASPAVGTEEILGLVRSDLEKVEHGLREKVRSAVPIVEQINTYVHASGGKRLRPALALLCSKLCGFDGMAAIHLGVILELIHVATLVHDDIIDNAKVRRGRPSVHAQWGNPTTVLMGDWLYMTSFHLALDFREMRVLDILINITRKLVEGELLQLEFNASLDISRDEQLAICRRKTAYLFGGCCKLAAIVSRQGAEAEDNLWNYGESLGIAFQLIDDLLDYTSDQDVMGKPHLKDLEEGKVTLPIIYLLERAGSAEVRFVREVVERQDFTPENKSRIIRLTQEYGVIAQVRQDAEEYAAQATYRMEQFPDNVYREALLKLPQFVLNRKK